MASDLIRLLSIHDCTSPPRRLRSPGPVGYYSQSLSTLIMTLLAVIVSVAAYGIFSVVRGAPATSQYVAWAACAMLVVTAFVMLLVARITAARSMSLIVEQLHALSLNNNFSQAHTCWPSDIQEVLSALSAYVDQVRTRMEQLHLQKKQLDIQMRAATAERSNAEAIILSISEAVIVIDSLGQLTLANASAEALFSFRFADWRHRPIDRLLADASLVDILRDTRLFDGSASRRQVEYGIVCSGRTQTFNIMLSPVIDTHGHSQGVVAVFHDITHERELAQIKSDFVSAVSHELRTPLSSIKAYVEMLVDGEDHDDDTRQHFYQIIESETNRLQRLISNILNISRIEAGVVDIDWISLCPTQLINEVIQVMMPHAHDKNITLRACVNEPLSCIWGDHDLIYQAVLNVVSNAIKYTPREGQVTIEAGSDTQLKHVAITIRDNGMGIHTRDLPRIFDKFYRASHSAAAAKGTGLGLNLVKHIVETVHNGDISVTSELGAGTTVTLRLPLLSVGSETV